MKVVSHISLALAALTLLAGMVFVSYQAQFAQGSVFPSAEYNSVVITAADIGTTSLKTITGSIGSVVVTEASADVAPLRFYAVTATTAATSTLTSIAEVDTGAVENTYQFDAISNAGILIDVPVGFTGNYTITYR